MFALDHNKFDATLTLALYEEKRALQHRRLTALFNEIGAYMPVSPTLKGLGSKLAKFKHDVEYDAAQLSNEIDAASSETKTTFATANDVLAQHRKDLEDVKAFVADVAAVTNGGPPLNPPSPAPTPAAAPVVPLASGAPSNPQA